MDKDRLDLLLELLVELRDKLEAMHRGPRKQGRAPVRAPGELQHLVLELGQTGDITCPRAQQAAGLLRHSARGYLSRLCKQGLVARVAPATYRPMPVEPLEVTWST